jgi:hypothetical protein
MEKVNQTFCRGYRYAVRGIFDSKSYTPMISGSCRIISFGFGKCMTAGG